MTAPLYDAFYPESFVQDRNLAEAEAEIERLKKVILAIDAGVKDDAPAQTQIERNMWGLRAVEKIDVAFAAIGGEPFDEKQCQCDLEVNWHCEYCAIHDALRASMKALAHIEGKDLDR